MAHIHIAATPGVTIDGFRAVAAKHNPPMRRERLKAHPGSTGNSPDPCCAVANAGLLPQEAARHHTSDQYGTVCL